VDVGCGGLSLLFCARAGKETMQVKSAAAVRNRRARVAREELFGFIT
jgi:hypothetical protein